jgi:hypothetical protein
VFNNLSSLFSCVVVWYVFVCMLYILPLLYVGLEIQLNPFHHNIHPAPHNICCLVWPWWESHYLFTGYFIICRLVSAVSNELFLSLTVLFNAFTFDNCNRRLFILCMLWNCKKIHNGSVCWLYCLGDILVIIFSFSVVDVLSSLPTTNLMKSNKSVSPFLYIAPHVSITVGIILNYWKVISWWSGWWYIIPLKCC